jgi:hypothetical protein
MSEPTRYTAVGNGVVRTDPEGLIIAYGHYVELKAEVERLTKAGDGLYKSMLEIGCNEMADNFEYDAWWGSMKDWNAAKEGKGQP